MAHSETPSFIPPQEQETPSNLEKWLSSELPKQYEEKAKILNELGLLEILPECGEIGIVGIDGKEYPLPSEEQIKEEILTNREVFETKMKQGFTELEITPFALPLERLIHTTKETILKHHKEEKLFGTMKNQEDESEPLEPLELNEDEPLFVWEEFKDADTNGTLAYYPKEFSENHQGFTKQELLDASRETPFPGFNVYFREKDVNLREDRKRQMQENRRQFDIGKSSEEYLKILQTQEEYQSEHGQTPEDWFTLFLTHLKKTNQVIDDAQGNGSDNLLIGSYSSASGNVGNVGWSRLFRQSSLSGYGSEVQDSNSCVHTVVRIPPLNA
ncbi:hypothetical protein KKH43_05585 [Patescibacteria group bacterium]|nr:hypothetical protein [Patescibacteria group bacterium]